MHRCWIVCFNLFWCLTNNPSTWLSGCSLFTTFPSGASILYVNKCLPSAPEIWDQELQRYCEILSSSTLSALDKENFRAYSKAYISIFLQFFLLLFFWGYLHFDCSKSSTVFHSYFPLFFLMFLITHTHQLLSPLSPSLFFYIMELPSGHHN